jgi:SAM-dependent methyltransferase
MPRAENPWDEVGRRLQDGPGRSSIFDVTAQACESILNAVDPRGGARALEIGCGRGDFLALAAARDIEIVGLDLAPEMVRVLKSRYPRASAIVGDATALPFADEAFDLVVCSFTLGFVEDRRRAIAEAWRVLAPGGRYALTTWNLIPGAYFAFVEEAVRRHGERGEDAFVPSNPGTRYYEDLLLGAGFREVRVATLGLALHFARATDVLEVVRTSGKARALVESQSDDARQRIEAELVSRMERVGDAEFHMEMPAFLVQGTKRSSRDAT